MKKTFLLMITAIMFCVASAQTQNMTPGLVNAFKKGNAQDLSFYLGNQVEIIIQNRSQYCNKASAQKAMANFFATNRVIGFTVNHQGERNESGFVIGTLNTASGSFRVNCFFKKNGNNPSLIHQIRIDKTNE